MWIKLLLSPEIIKADYILELRSIMPEKIGSNKNATNGLKAQRRETENSGVGNRL